MAKSPTPEQRDKELDEALGESFPASDPAMTEPKPARSRPPEEPTGKDRPRRL